ncbi:DUF4886 domain-containing protein [Emcibacter sp.]|uniref:DUF4886 domain-containing protein n=1 Tax=Emcibacter sp. TaxID=1979954 RepID=UPI003A8D7B13
MRFTKTVLNTLGFISVVICLYLSHANGAGAAEPARRVLFVGNSFSFYNNGIHNQTANLIRAAGQWKKGKNRFRLLTLSGGWMSEQKPLLQTYLKNTDDKWNVVVLQGHSLDPIKDGSGFRNAVGEMAKIVRKTGAQPVLFMTWAYENKPEMTTELARGYLEAGKEFDIPVVPVGMAFQLVEKTYPEIDLFTPDILGQDKGNVTFKKTLKHPSPAGTYLAACVFYSIFMNQSPVGNPYHAGLSAVTAEKLQNVAWQITNHLSP